jgi:hypothetical protein
MDFDFHEFRKEILKLGFYDYEDQVTLFKFGKSIAQCGRTAGLAVGGAGAVLGAPAFGVGAAAGFLAGLAGGTLVCTAGSLLYREQIKQILAEEKGK